MDVKKIIREMCLGAMAEGKRGKEIKPAADHLVGTKASACQGVSLAQSKYGREAGQLMARETCLTSHFARPC